MNRDCQHRIREIEEKIDAFSQEMKKAIAANKFNYLQHLKSDFFSEEKSIEEVVNDILRQEEDLKVANEKSFKELSHLLQNC